MRRDASSTKDDHAHERKLSVHPYPLGSNTPLVAGLEKVWATNQSLPFTSANTSCHKKYLKLSINAYLCSNLLELTNSMIDNVFEKILCFTAWTKICINWKSCNKQQHTSFTKDSSYDDKWQSSWVADTSYFNIFHKTLALVLIHEIQIHYCKHSGLEYFIVHSFSQMMLLCHKYEAFLLLFFQYSVPFHSKNILIIIFTAWSMFLNDTLYSATYPINTGEDFKI